MRLRRALAFSLLAPAVAGCVHRPAPPVGRVTVVPRPAPAPSGWRVPFMRAGTTAPVAVVAAPAAAPVAVVAAPVAVVPAVAAPPIAYMAAVRTAPAPGLPDPVYHLDAGDRLRVVVFGQEGLSNSYMVDASGAITMPLIGAVPARGRSTAELSREVAARLRRDFIRDPQVAIEVELYRPFFILGEVQLPGQYPYVADMTVEKAVAIAGGFTPRAWRYEFKITRMRGGQLSVGAVPPTYPLQPGDTIHVAERWF